MPYESRVAGRGERCEKMRLYAVGMNEVWIDLQNSNGKRRNETPRKIKRALRPTEKEDA